MTEGKVVGEGHDHWVGINVLPQLVCERCVRAPVVGMVVVDDRLVVVQAA